jgi:hypothetical protein
MCLRGGESELAAMRVRAAGEQARQAHKVAGLTRRVGYRASAGYRDPLRDIASRRDIPHTSARFPASAGYRNPHDPDAISRCSTISHAWRAAISHLGRISRPTAISRRGGISHTRAQDIPPRQDIATRKAPPRCRDAARYPTNGTPRYRATAGYRDPMPRYRDEAGCPTT